MTIKTNKNKTHANAQKSERDFGEMFSPWRQVCVWVGVRGESNSGIVEFVLIANIFEID